jgi:hypothetical protein
MARLWLRDQMAARVLVGLVVLVPFLLAVPYAMFNPPLDPLGGLGGLGGPIGVLIAARRRDPAYWRLDKESRRRVREVQHTGQPSGDRQVDDIAVARLSMSAEKEKANVVVTPVALTVMIATPAVAALRTGHEWWFVASLPAVLCLAWWLAVGRGEGPRVRLDRLTAQLGRAPYGA